MKKIVKFFTVFLLGVFMLGSSLSPNQLTLATEEATTETPAYKVGFSATTMNNPFFHAIEEAVREHVEANGGELIVVDAQNDPQTQLSLVEDLIVQDIDVLLICPVDSASIKSALQAANDAGIPIVNFDTDVIDVDLVDSIVVSDNYKAGVLVAEDMMSKLPEGSKVSILTSPTAEASVLRVDGFVDTAGEYFEIVSQLDGKGDTATSLGVAEDVLSAHPDLGAFFAINDPSALGAVQAIESQQRTGEILVYGVDGAPDGKQGVSESKMEATAAQSPINIGKTTIETAYEILAGNEVEEFIEVETFLITRENIDEYDLEGWQ